MQIKDHIALLRRSLAFMLVFGLVVGAITYVLASRRAPSYQAIQTYNLQLVNRSNTADYQYGSYYDLKGAELFTQHVMSMLRSPAVIEAIYQQAGIGYTIDSVSRFTSQFRTDQGSSQQVTVTFSRYSSAEAQALADAMTVVLEREVSLAQMDTDGRSMFYLSALPPVVVYQPVNVTLMTTVAVCAGWLLALMLVHIRRYLQ